MLDINPLFEFSRSHCIAICAVLVPANLIATTLTLFGIGQHRSAKQVQQLAAIASLFALIMVLHVMTWLIIGIVMAPTFILLTLGSVCLLTNGWAIAHPVSLARLLNRLAKVFVSVRSTISTRTRQWKT
jgi:hypothetical protein